MVEFQLMGLRATGWWGGWKRFLNKYFAKIKIFQILLKYLGPLVFNLSRHTHIGAQIHASSFRFVCQIPISHIASIGKVIWTQSVLPDKKVKVLVRERFLAKTRSTRRKSKAVSQLLLNWSSRMSFLNHLALRLLLLIELV